MIPWTSEDPGACDLDELLQASRNIASHVESLSAVQLSLTGAATGSTGCWAGTAGDGWRGKAAIETTHLTTTATMFANGQSAVDGYYASVASIRERAEPLRTRLAEVRASLVSPRWNHCQPLLRGSVKSPKPPLLELEDCAPYDALVVEEASLVSQLQGLADERAGVDLGIMTALADCVPPGVAALRLALQTSGVNVNNHLTAQQLKDFILEQAAWVATGEATDAEIDALGALLNELDDPSGVVDEMAAQLGDAWMLTLVTELQQRCVPPSSGAVTQAGGLLALVANLPVGLLDKISASHPEVFDTLIAVTEYEGVDLAAMEAWQAKVTGIWSVAGLEQQQRLINHASALIGNLNGIPFESRYEANRVNIEQWITTVSVQIYALEMLADSTGRSEDVTLNELRDKLALYESLLEPFDFKDGRGMVNRQILLFDGRGNGRFAQVYGDLSTATNVGTLLGGTNTNMLENQRMADLWASELYVNGARKNLAMISWMGTDFPQLSPMELPSKRVYANDAAARISAFSVALQRETTGQDGEGPQMTFAGHSYGGVMIGAAEALGLLADRTLYIEAAGGGPNVSEASDYQNASTERFSLMAPGDPMRAIDTTVQTESGPIYPWLGVGPRNMDGVTNLDTGKYKDGTPITGWGGHNGVFLEGTDSRKRMLEVLLNEPFGARGFN